MQVKNILLLVLTIIIVYMVYQRIRSDIGGVLTSATSAKVQQTIGVSSLDPSQSGSANYAYSIWLYVDDWSYRFSERKIVMRRGPGDAAGIGTPTLALGAMVNDLTVSLNVYNDTSVSPTTPPPATTTGSTTTTTPTTTPTPQTTVFSCSVSNIPIQRWVNVVVSVYGRTLDIYINGKLVKTCVMPGVSTVPAVDESLFVTPGGGFSGYTSNVQYFSTPRNPEEVWNIYARGYGGGLLGNLFGKYAVRVALVDKSGNTSSAITL